MPSEIINVVAPIFVLTGLGYLWVKRDMPFDNATVSNLVMYLATPSLVFSSLTALNISTNELFTMGAATLCLIFGCLCIAYPVLRLAGWSRHAFLPAMIQPNTGNMGLPLVLLTFGETGLALGVVVFFIHAVSQYSLGVGLSSGQLQLKWLARQPIIWSVILSALVLWQDLTVPLWISNTTDLLGGLLIPGMLLMLGASLARFGITEPGKILSLAAFRLLLGISVGCAVIWLFDLRGQAAGVMLLQASMPVAVFNFVFAERFDRNPDQVAALVLASTLLTLAILPLLVGVILKLPG